MRGRACLLAEPAAGPAGWPDAGLGRYGLACYGRLAGLWMAVAGFLGAGGHGLSRLGGYGGLAALCPAVAGVSTACLDAARLYEADSACRLPCPADCRS